VIAVARKPSEPPLVLVEWVRDMTDAVGGGHVGDRVYRGVTGERVRMPEGAALVLSSAGFVEHVAEPEQVT